MKTVNNLFYISLSRIIYSIIVFLFLLISIYKTGEWCIKQSNQHDILRYRSGVLKVQREFYKDKHTRAYTKKIQTELKCAPVPKDYFSAVTFEDSYGAERTQNTNYNPNGSRIHEGCDLMYDENKAGIVPVISMTDGTVEQLGWLTLGGYRVGIRSSKGIYYYYAHLDSYKEGLSVGDKIFAGDLLGFMGDTGYGDVGTRGQFPVHLHVGIYVNKEALSDCKLPKCKTSYGMFLIPAPGQNLSEEYAINPYEFVRRLFP